MSLRRKTLVIIGVVLASLVVLLVALSQTVLLDSFRQLEEREMRQNVLRAVNALDEELATLNTSCADYAYWDDTYAYVQYRTADYLEVTLTDDSLLNVGVDVVTILDAAGSPIYQGATSGYSIPPDLTGYLEPGSPLVTDVQVGSGRGGVILTQNGPLLVTVHPIVDSLRVEPPRGLLVFGRYLNAPRIDAISAALQLPLTIYPLGQPFPEDVQTAREALSADFPVFVQPLGETVAGYAMVQDVTGAPALVLRVESPRSLYTQGTQTVNLFLFLLIASGLVFGVVTVLLLERAVLSRLRQLGRSVQTIAQSGNIQGRVPVSAADQDELTTLAQDINRMLTALETAQINLRFSDDRLRAVVNSAPIMLWAVDSAGKITLLEGRSLDLLGIERALSIGKPFSQVYRNVPQLVSEVQRAAKGEAFSSLVPISAYSFDVSYTPMRSEKGVVGVIGVATDITERVLAEEALGEAYDTLEHQKNQLDRVRELLRSTLEQINDTLNRGAPREELHEYLQFVQTQFNRMDQESARNFSGSKR